jgi:hypothetical protein
MQRGSQWSIARGLAEGEMGCRNWSSDRGIKKGRGKRDLGGGGGLAPLSATWTERVRTGSSQQHAGGVRPAVARSQ